VYRDPCVAEFGEITLARYDCVARRLSMQHRHILPFHTSAAAIDDIIERGTLVDWYELRQAAMNDPEVLQRIERIARRRAEDLYAQRFHFWMRYAASLRAAS
jgi:hypothetical protein